MKDKGVFPFSLFGFRVKMDLIWLFLGFPNTWTLARLRKRDSGRLMVARDGKRVGIVSLRDIMNVVSLKMEID